MGGGGINSIKYELLHIKNCCGYDLTIYYKPLVMLYNNIRYTVSLYLPASSGDIHCEVKIKN